MAVFTKLNKKEIEEFISIYNIGKLDFYNEIVEGIENTNYKIICSGIPYILTIFEKRVEEQDLPFFMDLKLYLINNNFECPKPIKNRENKIINSLKNKKAVIISFIEGEIIKLPNTVQCKEVGKMIGNLHKITKNFNQKKENSLSIKEWKNLFHECEINGDEKFKSLYVNLRHEIDFLEKSWPKGLPSGIIHADLFRDNVFFKNKKITGVIDFYFACYDFFLYDISIVINDWCFEENGEIFKNDSFRAIVKNYNAERQITNEEFDKFNILLRAAAVRILVTRLYDYIFHPKDAIVVKKDPYEYYNILRWHQHNKIQNI